MVGGECYYSIGIGMGKSILCYRMGESIYISVAIAVNSSIVGIFVLVCLKALLPGNSMMHWLPAS